MDPDANITEQRQLVALILAGDEADEPQHAHRLAELSEALDGWITGGGFLPTEWRMAQERAGRSA